MTLQQNLIQNGDFEIITFPIENVIEFGPISPWETTVGSSSLQSTGLYIRPIVLNQNWPQDSNAIDMYSNGFLTQTVSV